MFAAVIVRIVGTWLAITGLINLLYRLFVLDRAALLGQARWTNGLTAIDWNLHDTYYLIAPHFGLIGLGARIITGLLLFFAAKPFTRLLLWRIGD